MGQGITPDPLFMRIILIHILFFLLFSNFILKAQLNLVPNGSFELKDTCPTYLGQLPFISHFWDKSDQTTELFDKCGNYLTKIPQNWSGTQQSIHGNSYGGFILYRDFNTPLTYCEYIQTSLLTPLTDNYKYCLSFDYSIAEFPSLDFYNIPYIPIKIGMHFTDTPLYRVPDSNGYLQPYNFSPTIYTNTAPFEDTINWIHIDEFFYAPNKSKYLTFGFFKVDSSDVKTAIYLYIDDIKLYYCGPDTTQPPIVDSLIIPNIFTPNADGYNDKFEYKNQEHWNFETQVFNRWGDLVFENKSSENWDGYYKGNKVSAGVYFYIIKAQAIRTGEVRVYKGHVTVM
jgi:gliding motility-associated-like protein